MADIMELSGADLDAVAGGAQGGNALAAGGLVNVALGAVNLELLEQADINVDIIDDVTIKNIANNNNVSVGAIIQLLGGGAAVLTRQAQ